MPSTTTRQHATARRTATTTSRVPRARRRCRVALVATLGLLAAITPMRAQDEGPASTEPAFSLSSAEVVTPGSAITISVGFERIDHLDFRIYRVADPVAFFAGLRELHNLGSPEPVVEQERTLIERIAAWKASWRASVRDFVRAQVSWEYRQARNTRRNASTPVVTRQRVAATGYAQIAPLNPAQVVESFREILPNHRDYETRSIPLDLKSPGIYLVEATNARLRAYTVVIVSNLGLITKAAPGQVVLYAADRASGDPKADCATAIVMNQKVQAQGSTGADGTYVTDVPHGEVEGLVALAQCGDDTIVADPGGYFLRERARELAGYIYTDRPVYRPGHTVNFKGILRWKTRGQVVPFDRPAVEVAIVDPDDKVLQRTERPVDAFGAVHGSFVVPATSSLGDYSVRVISEDDAATGSFEVQEYRKPEFEVDVRVPTRFIQQGKQATATIRAKYYFGQPVAGGRVTYVIYRGGYYSPYRYVDTPGDEPDYYSDYYGDQVFEGTATLDANGEARVPVQAPVSDTAADMSLKVDARVTDSSEREVSGKATLNATWGTFLLAVDTGRYMYQPGTTANVRVRAVDYAGVPQARVPVTLTLERRYYDEPGEASTAQALIATTTVTTDTEGRATWPAAIPAEGGSYVFKARAPSAGRTVEGEASIGVPRTDETYYEGGDSSTELASDKAQYAPGETARIIVRGEDVAGAVLATKERDTTSWKSVVRLESGDVVDVPIEADDIGDVYVNVAFVRKGRLFTAERRLRVPPVTKQITLTVTPAQPVAKPRDPAVFALKATDYLGAPVRAQLSLGVVDEAVYGVRPDTTTDPLRFFYRRAYSEVSTSFSRQYYFTGYSGSQALKLAQRRRPLTLADFKAERPARDAVRKDFPDAIYWLADLVTDARGEATVTLNYPDSLTTWRLTARAVTADTMAGVSVARTTTTKDVIVRLATPRFLTEGDTVHVPLVAHSYLPQAAEFAVKVDATGIAPTSAATTDTRKVSIASRGENRSSWSYTADRVGTATLTARATSAQDDDAMQVGVPVLPYGLRRDTGTSGSITDTSERSVSLEIPAASNPAARSIDISLAPSMAGSLLGALDFLTGYPYGCTEQTLSSFLPNLLVLQALEQLKLEPTERVRLAPRMADAGVRRLYDYQHEGGGFGWWKTDEDHPFMTAYALYGLVEARRAGRPVDRARLERAAAATTQLYAEYPRMVPDLKAYLAYALAQAATLEIAPEGWDAAAVVAELWDARSRMSSQGHALLLMALDLAKDARASELAQSLADAAQTRGDLAWWPADRDPLLDDWGDSSVEATALAIQALAQRDPTHALLEPAVRWLLANRASGSYWSTTKQSAMALYGLLAYMKARNEQPATFSVDVFVNGAKVATHEFTPAMFTAPNPVVITAPATAGSNAIRIVKRGGGSLYWTATARYFDNRESFEQTGTRKLALSRKYFSLAPVQVQGRTVYRETPFEGNAKPGDLILVRMTVAGAADWRYLAIEDPLPAGAEAIERMDAFDLERRDDRSWWYGRARREYRDNRVVQFEDRLPGGRVDFVYMLRVVTPGVFRAMPAQVTPMYVPGVSASTPAIQVNVADPAATPPAVAPSQGGVR